MTKRMKITVLGTSAGGTDALLRFLGELPKSYSPPVIIVQHLPENADIDPSLVFYSTGRKVVLVEDKMPIETDQIYFSPPGYHTLVEPEGFFSLSVDAPVHFSRPSIDVLFESAARSFGPWVTGILLTGANQDGAEGLKSIQERGGRTIVEDPETAASPLMPREALRRFQPDAVVRLEDLAKTVLKFGKEVVTDENESPYR